MSYALSKKRREASSAIDAEAAYVRSRHITGQPGQDLVYAAKLAQAQAYLDAHAANAAATVPPYVAADVAVAGGTAQAAAQAIVAASAAFHAGPGPAIEHARRAGKTAVHAAGSPEAVDAARDAALAALAAI